MLGPAQHTFRQAVLTGDIKRLTCTNLIIGKAEERFFGNGIKQNGRCANTGLCQGVTLQGREVGCGYSAGPAFKQTIQNRLS